MASAPGRVHQLVAQGHQHTLDTPDLVEHSAEIYGISGSGKVTTLYPATFKPQQIVHDVPLLATQ